MAWNEPGGGNKDPWSGGGGDQGPPDLDEVVKKLQERLGGLFGGGPRDPNTPQGPGGGQDPGLSGKLIGALLGVTVLIWLASGFYIIGPAERGVELRFGKYSETEGPGPHWHIPLPIERVIRVNVDEITSFTHEASMLTQDENIVDVKLTVQSRIQDAPNYLFQDQDPVKTLRDATATVVRVTIGGSQLDYVMTEGRSAVAQIIKERIQALMDHYQTGLLVTTVNMQPAKPPEQVKAAFDDAIKAREDKERLENQAEAYANEVIPRARGEAARIIADAKAYRDKVIAESEGEAARFTAVLAEYLKAPEVTRERLYLETIEQVLGENSKVLIDMKEGGNSLIYLPIEQLIKGGQANVMSTPDTSMSTPLTPAPVSAAQSANQPQRVVDRERRMR